MTSFRLNARRPIDPPADDGFEVTYVPDDGAVRMPLARAWEMPLERSLPVRRFTSRKGQRHLSGLWWSATTDGPVGVRVLLETRSCAASGFRPVRGRHRVAAVVAALDRRRGALLLPNPLAEQVHRVSSHRPATGGAGQTSCHPVKNRGHEAFWIESVKLRLNGEDWSRRGPRPVRHGGVCGS